MSGAPAEEKGSGPEGELEVLRAEHAWLRSVLRYVSDVLITTDLGGRITDWSGGAERILGYAREEVLGSLAASLYVEPDTRRELVQRLRERNGEPLLDQEIQVRHRSGKKVWLSCSISELRDPTGRRIGTVGVSKDVTERKRLERELRRLSTTDKLTGLYNQSHFFGKLEVEKERAARLGDTLGLVLFDLDNFKQYNDLHGHEAGDKVLRAIGSIVFASIRKEVDSGFRYGGDEFCCLLPGATSEGALVFAERLRASIESSGHELVTASIGLCTLDPGDRAVQIVKAADAAMYRAKRAGGNRICLHGREGEWRRGVHLGEAPKGAILSSN